MIMANNELTQTYTIPLKSCQNSVIEHSLVSICLRIEWPEKGGDDPSLVIDVTNKQLLNSYGQPNQPSLLVNSVHHQHQDNLPSKYQQQYYHSSGINNYDSTNLPISNSINDHNDISSMTTTTTVVYNAHQPQYQPSTSPTAIQKIKSDLKSQLPSFNQSYLSSQHVIQAPLNNLNDSRLDINMSTMNPTSSIKQVSSMINPYYDLQQSSISNNSQLRSLICTCPNPTIYHAHNCPLHFSNHQDFSSESIHRTNIQHISSLPSMKEPMITKTSMPFPNTNLMKTIDLSSNVTTIISQPPTFLNNPSMCPTIKIPSMNINNNFSQQHRHHHHPQPLNVSQVIINNPSNYPINSSLPMPIIGQQNIGSKKPRARKKPIKRNSVNNQEQDSNQSQEINFINNQNSPTKQQNINTPSLLSSQPRMVILQDNSQITANTSSGSKNDLDIKSTEQLSPLTNSNVRSPVELNVHIPLSKTTTNQAKPTEVVDQVISEVLEGKGIIRTHNSSKGFISQQQKSPLSSKLVWESNGATTTTKTFVAPLNPKPQPQQSLIFDSNISTSNHQNIFPITQQTIHSNSIEQNQINNTLSTTTTTTNAKKTNTNKINK